MKRFLILAMLLMRTVSAGESGLTVTYQPLDGLGAGGIHIAQVTCHDWYAHSGLPTQIGLISVPNVPPTNHPEQATQNLNLASTWGLRFSASDIGDPKAALELKLDARKLSVPESSGHPREDVVPASLECLRRCLPDKLRNTPVSLECADADRKWLTPLVAEFNAHNRSKAFFAP